MRTIRLKFDDAAELFRDQSRADAAELFREAGGDREPERWEPGQLAN